MDDIAAQPVDPAPVDHAGPDRPVFVVACPRSGTTLLQLMLSAHPRLAIPPENRFMIDGWMQRDTFGDLTDPANHEALAQWIVTRRMFKDLQLDRDAVKGAIVAGPPTIGSAMGIVLREYAAAKGKPRWGDKRPVYLKHLDWLLEMFPDAQFVHIIRDGRDCVASLKRMRWWRGGSLTAVSRWVQSMRMGRRARAALRPDQYYELQYEHLVANPREELNKLCAFLGEEFAESMLEHHRAPEAAPKYKKWHKRTSRAVTNRAVNQWAEQLEPWELAVTELVGRRYLRRYGYERSAQRPTAPPRKLAQAWLDVRRREVGTWRLRHHDRKVAKSYPHPVAAQLTSGQRQLALQRGELFPPAAAAEPRSATIVASRRREESSP